jgi:excisionase family DNA binding protein
MASKTKPVTEAVSNSVAQAPLSFNGAAILTKQQAAEYLQTTPRYIERMVSSGRLHAFKPTGKLWRVRLSDLTAFLESGASIKA